MVGNRNSISLKREKKRDRTVPPEASVFWVSSGRGSSLVNICSSLHSLTQNSKRHCADGRNERPGTRKAWREEGFSSSLVFAWTPKKSTPGSCS